VRACRFHSGVGNKPSDYDEKDVEFVAYIADVIWEIVERKRRGAIARISALAGNAKHRVAQAYRGD